MEGTLLQSLFVRFGLDASSFSDGIKSVESQSEGSFGKISGLGSGMADTITSAFSRMGVALSAVGIGTFAIKTSMEFQEAAANIERATGAVGAQAGELKSVFDSLYVSSGKSATEISSALAKVAVETKLTGQALQSLTADNLAFAKVTGGDVVSSVEETQKVFKQFGVTADQQSAGMDMLYSAMTNTGISIGDLTGQMAGAGASMRAFGFSFTETTALAASFYEKGLSLDSVVGALRVGMTKLAEAGKDPKEALQALIEKMQVAATYADAVNIAADQFGKRGATVLADSVLKGAWNVKDLTDRLSDSSGMVDKMAASTKTLGETMAQTWHVIQESFSSSAIPTALQWILDGANKSIAIMSAIPKMAGALLGIGGGKAATVGGFYGPLPPPGFNYGASGSAGGAGGVPTIPVTTIQDTFKPITNDVSNDAKVLADVEANIRSGMDSTSESIAKSGLTIQDYFTKQVDDATRSMNSLADAIPPMATVEEAAGDPTDKLRGFMADLDKQIQATQQTAMDTTAWGAMQTAMHDLGLKSSIDLANLAASSAADYQVILNSGVATAEDVEKAWVKSATDRANADLASGKITQGQYDQIIKNLGTVKTTTDQTASYLAKQLTSISKSVGSAFADLIVDGGKFGDAMMKVLKQITKTIIEDVVQYAFGSLLKAIGGALSASSALGTALKNIGADMTKVFGGSGGAASTATGAAGSAASVGGGTASGATGAVAGGLTGILTSVFTGISAITGIIGLSETAHSNTLLTRIEGNTRGLLNVVYLNGAGTLVDCAIRSFQMLGSIHDILAGGIGINSTVVAVGGGGPSYNFDLRYSVFNGVANVDDLVKQLRARTGLR